MTLDLERAFAVMSLARHLDDRMWQAAKQGRAHFAVPCAGHEAVGIGYASALRPGFDFVAPHYRDLAALLWLGLEPRDAMLHFFARGADPMAGARQPYAHFGSGLDKLRIISLQGPQPNHCSHGAGVAWGSKLLGEDSVVWISFGDGGAQKGEVHETMNFAAVHRLPCVFCIESNGYTQSVPADLEAGPAALVDRAAGYGMPGEAVDGMEVLAVHEAAARAVARARSGGGPTLIEARCYRFRPNTSNDDDSRYRAAAEVERWRARDPLRLLRARLPAARADALAEESSTIAAEAAHWAEAQPSGDPATVLEHTYSG